MCAHLAYKYQNPGHQFTIPHSCFALNKLQETRYIGCSLSVLLTLL